MCLFRKKEPKQMQSVAKALYTPSSNPTGPVMEDYVPSAKSSKTRLAPPTTSGAHRNSNASGAGETSLSTRTSDAGAQREEQQAKLRALVTQRHNDAPDSPFVYPALAPWIESGQLAALLQQDALVEAGDELGGHRFDVDMEAGTLTFTGDDGRKLECRAHLLCSIAPGPRSILWGWAHPRGDEVAAGLRRLGKEQQITELSADELPFPDGFGPTDEDIAALAHQIGWAAVGILKRGPYYSAPNGPSRVLFILDAPLPTLTLATAVTKAPRMLSSGLINNPRCAVEGLADMMRWNMNPAQEGSGIQLSDGTSAMTVMFDENGRCAHLTGSLAGAPDQPQPQEHAQHAQPSAPTVSATAA
ncbi:hypothetical protein CspeluHIS016_0407640 [Cutaneotrichosporon spelunceum]|uniref:Uncharacterized protein n=1 Tax=Cutaneotrichosporon spelunceum TaxID=1672016 RepID=A0AAD3TW01_9TREE|nr:hypothetical protein CspeluHIS016_0407640 [Cutaneotrichosporon spelunceum]